MDSIDRDRAVEGRLVSGEGDPALDQRLSDEFDVKHLPHVRTTAPAPST
jgi:hypothetical protein